MAEQGKKKPRNRRVFEGGLPVVRRNVAGIDIGKKGMQIAGPPGEDGTPDLLDVPTTTREIMRAAEWLRERQVESVAMESTGVYWIPVLEILESAGFEVVLTDSRPLARVPGRKTDMLDCQWIQRLHSCGLLRGCYRPSPEITELRTIARSKAVLVGEQADWIRRIQKVLQEMNVLVHHAVSDLNGTTGMSILRAIVNGERDPNKLAALRDPRCRHSREQIVEYLTGNWRSDHLYNLGKYLKSYDFIQAEIEDYEREISRRMKDLTPAGRDGKAPPLAKGRLKGIKRRGEKERRDELFRMVGVDLTSIDGIGVETAETIVSEYGIDLSRFETEKQFVRHIQLAPRQNVSGGKQNKKPKGKTTTTRTAQALRNAATAVSRGRTALAGYYRAQLTKSGPGVAVFATARKLATYVFRLLKYGQTYFDEGRTAYEERYKAIRLRRMNATAAQLGYELVKKAAVTA